MKQQLMMLLLGTASVFCSCETQVEQHEKNELRAPAYPLVTIDPYTSAWSTTDNLYDSPVKHWTGKDFSLLGCKSRRTNLPFHGNGRTGTTSFGKDIRTR